MGAVFWASRLFLFFLTKWIYSFRAPRKQLIFRMIIKVDSTWGAVVSTSKSLMHFTNDVPGGSAVRNLPVNAGDPGDVVSNPGSGRSPGEGNSNGLQYSCLENPMDSGSGGEQSMGLQRVEHDSATKQTTIHYINIYINLYYILYINYMREFTWIYMCRIWFSENLYMFTYDI